MHNRGFIRKSCLNRLFPTNPQVGLSPKQHIWHLQAHTLQRPAAGKPRFCRSKAIGCRKNAWILSTNTQRKVFCSAFLSGAGIVSALKRLFRCLSGVEPKNTRTIRAQNPHARQIKKQQHVRTLGNFASKKWVFLQEKRGIALLEQESMLHTCPHHSCFSFSRPRFFTQRGISLSKAETINFLRPACLRQAVFSSACLSFPLFLFPTPAPGRIWRLQAAVTLSITSI